MQNALARQLDPKLQGAAGRLHEAGCVALERVAEAGVDLADVFAVLEREGVEKFEKAWAELLDGVSAELAKAAK